MGGEIRETGADDLPQAFSPEFGIVLEKASSSENSSGDCEWTTQNFQGERRVLNFSSHRITAQNRHPLRLLPQRRQHARNRRIQLMARKLHDEKVLIRPSGLRK